MRALVLGASGQIGAMSVKDLVEFYKADVMATSRDEGRVKKAVNDLRVDKNKVTTGRVDAHDKDAVIKAIKDHKADVVLNAAWYQTNLNVMDACLKGGAHYTDLGGFFDTTLKQLELGKKFGDAGLKATVGLGSTPGITNLAGACGASRLDTVDSIDITCSWGNTLPVKEAGWPGYSIRTVIDEFSQEPIIWKNGKYAKMPVLSGEVLVNMQEPIGKVKAYLVKHSEPATMGKYISNKPRNVAFRIGFPEVDLQTFKTLKALGFGDEKPLKVGNIEVSPLDFLTVMYQRGISESRGAPSPKEEYEYDAFRIDVKGEKDGLPAEDTLFITTWNDPQTGLSSARDTSVPPSIACAWMVQGKIKRDGVFPLEGATEDFEGFFRELGKRKIRVEEQMTRTTRYY